MAVGAHHYCVTTKIPPKGQELLAVSSGISDIVLGLCRVLYPLSAVWFGLHRGNVVEIHELFAINIAE